MRQFLIIIFIFTLSSAQCYAQLSGYFGKTKLIGINAGYTPVSRIKYNPCYSLRINSELTIRRRISLQVSLDKTWHKYNFQYAVFNGNILGKDNFTDYVIRPASENNKILSAYTFHLGASFKFFSRRYIAPVGRYIKLGSGINRVGLISDYIGITYKQYSPGHTDPDSPVYYKNIYPENKFRQHIYLNFGFGKVIPLGERILLDFYTETHFNIHKDIVPRSLNYFYNVDDYINHSIWQGIYLREFLHLNIAIYYTI